MKESNGVPTSLAFCFQQFLEGTLVDISAPSQGPPSVQRSQVLARWWWYICVIRALARSKHL